MSAHNLSHERSVGKSVGVNVVTLETGSNHTIAGLPTDGTIYLCNKGGATQTVTLPDETALGYGHDLLIVNEGSGNLSVTDSGASSVFTVGTTASVRVTVTSNGTAKTWAGEILTTSGT